jgi:hypothetical protein
MMETATNEPTRMVELTPKELELVTTALKLLHGILGHEEAEELAEVTALLEKIRGRTPTHP